MAPGQKSGLYQPQCWLPNATLRRMDVSRRLTSRACKWLRPMQTDEGLSAQNLDRHEISPASLATPEKNLRSDGEAAIRQMER